VYNAFRIEREIKNDPATLGIGRGEAAMGVWPAMTHRVLKRIKGNKKSLSKRDIRIFNTPAETGRAAADRIETVLKKYPQGPVVIILPTGSTPIPMYKEIVRRFKETKIDLSRLVVFNLDEYIGLVHYRSGHPDEREERAQKRHPLSYYYYMQKNLYEPLDQIDPTRAPKPENRNIPFAAAGRTFEEAARDYEGRLQAAIEQTGRGRADLAIIGLGGIYPVLKDGEKRELLKVKGLHAGFNEAGSAADSRTRVIELAKKTIRDTKFRMNNFAFLLKIAKAVHTNDTEFIELLKEAGYQPNGVLNEWYQQLRESDAESVDEYHNNGRVIPERAITLGIANILESEELIVMATDEAKYPGVGLLYNEQPTADLPATFSKLHNGGRVLWFLTRDAAAALPHMKTPWATRENGFVWTAQSKRQMVLNILSKNEGLNIESLNVGHLSGMGVDGQVKVNELIKDANAFLMPSLHYWRTTNGMPDVPSGKRIVIFSPHPDDDVITMAATIKRLVGAGNSVTVIYAVGGENAVRETDARPYYESLREEHQNGSSGSVRPEIDEELWRLARIMVREDEARAAVGSINSAIKTVFLRLPYYYHRGIIGLKTVTDLEVEKMRQAIEEANPDMIFYSGEDVDPHGAHAVSTQIVRQAMVRSGRFGNIRVFAYRGAYLEWPLYEQPEHLWIVPFGEAEMGDKVEAIKQHVSQLDPIFPAFDVREFYERARDRNADTGRVLRQLGLVSRNSGQFAEVFKEMAYQNFVEGVADTAESPKSQPLTLRKIGGYQPRKGVLLIVMDGIGLSDKKDGSDAVDEARKLAHQNGQTFLLDELRKGPLYTTLKAHGTAVGMPTDADMGNSKSGTTPWAPSVYLIRERAWSVRRLPMEVCSTRMFGKG